MSMFYSVHGEFTYSCLPMPPPKDSEETGGRLSGEDMTLYVESFAERFLSDRIRYRTEVLNISRGPDSRWNVKINDSQSGHLEDLQFDRIVLCTGASSNCTCHLLSY